MSNDLQATISTNLGRTVAELAKVQTSLKQLHAEVRNVNRESNAFQQQGSKTFSEAGREAESMSGKVKELGHGMHFLGGGAGHAGMEIGRLAQFASAGGAAMGVLGAAMAVAGFAMEQYNKSIEQNIEFIKKQAEAEDEHREAVIKGKEAAEKNATAGGSDEANLAKLNYLSGGEGGKKAKEIADREHLDEKDVRKGLIEIYKLPKRLQENMIHAVTYATEAGAGSFSELASTGSRMPMLAGMNDTKRSGAMIAEKNLGMPMRGDVQRFSKSRRANMDEGSMYSQQGRLNDIANDKTRFEESQFTNTTLPVQGAQRDLDQTRDPVAFNLAEINRKTERTHALLQKIADHTDPIKRSLGVKRTDAQIAADNAQRASSNANLVNDDDITIPGSSPSDQQ